MQNWSPLFAQTEKPAAAPELQAPAPAAPAGPADAKAPAASTKGEPVKEGTAEAPADPAGNGNGFGGIETFAPFILIAFLFYFMMLRPQRKEQQQREEKLKQIKKNDRVVTIGGIIATVYNVSADGKEVTLKIDDNAKLHLRRDAIREILGGERADSEAAK